MDAVFKNSEMGSKVSQQGENYKCLHILVGKIQVKISLGRSRRG
jgi:hypothetical protein